ncbi:MAG: ABC transporter ATP-binding protein [Bacteroidaceae bacterium]|nr:ABC transporter ATP-binding protein [Bacteroidaceae bacterium]
MREFFVVMGRYLSNYKKYIAGAFVVNVLSAILNVFSFLSLVPILEILFQNEPQTYSFIEWSEGDLRQTAMNNIYYYSQILIEQFGPATTLLLLGGIMSVITMLKTGAYFGGSAIIMPLRTGVVRDIRNEIYRKILGLPLSFFSEERKGDILTRISTDVNEIDASVTSSLDALIKNPILIIVYVGTMLIISWQLTLFTVLVVPVLAIVIGKIGKSLKASSILQQTKLSDSISQVEETLGGLRIIKAFIAEKKMQDRFEKVNNEYRDIASRVAVRQSAAHPVSEFLGTVMIVIVLWFGGYLIFSGKSELDAGMFIYYLTILYTTLQPLKEISKAGYAVQKGLASMERVNMILKAQNPIGEVASPRLIDGLHDKIELRNVCFRYENSEREVLHDINLTIQKGQTIALVGQSGSGKSTLVDLVPRYHDVSAGELLIDGVNVKEFSIHSLRSLIGNVNQEAILFNDTVFNNIAFGVDNATQEQVEAAARIANAHDFIMEMEDGYQTSVGDRGCRLSGGQRQRISIARAILKNPPILILDEATSALDTESERLVQDALDKLMSTRTTIAIAHRLSTIRHASIIYVLHDGRIVEQGTHEELIAKGGYYKKLNDMQTM